MNKLSILLILAFAVVLGGAFYFLPRDLSEESVGSNESESDNSSEESNSLDNDKEAFSPQGSNGDLVSTSGQEQETEPENNNSPVGQSEQDPQQQEGSENLILYNSDGFSPKNVIIKVGETVEWRDVSGGTPDMWVASDFHPTHTIYGGTSRSQHCPNADNNAFDQCENSDEYAFTFNKKGEWKYHNHSRAGHTGTVIVE